MYIDWPDKITCPICGHYMFKNSYTTTTSNITYGCNMGTSDYNVTELHDLFISPNKIKFSIFTDYTESDILIAYKDNGNCTIFLDNKSIELDSINLYELNKLRLFL